MKSETGNAMKSGPGLYRVRHAYTGLYVAQSIRRARMAEHLVDGVNLFLDRQVNAVKAERALADKIANLWIALTGDHGIEIEPVEN